MTRRSQSAPSLQATLSQLLVANVLLLALAVGAGWAVSAARGARAEVATGHSDAGGAAGIRREAMVIFKANLRVMALFVLGACSLGILTVVLFLWNGYLLGFGLSALHRAEPGDMMYVLAYVPIEFAALTTAAAASMNLAVQILRALVAREPLALGSTAVAFIASLLLLASAAGVESCVKVRLSHLP